MQKLIVHKPKIANIHRDLVLLEEKLRKGRPITSKDISLLIERFTILYATSENK